MNVSDLPSKITDKKYLQVPSFNVVESDDEWAECGKWIIHNPRKDLEWIDKVWTDLQELVRNGCLIMLKASTLKSKLEFEKRTSKGETDYGVVMCFTRPGKEAAKKAAEEIRNIIHHEHRMYYKKNKKTDDGIARRFGDTNISDYMHTCSGRFYVRDAYSRWKEEAHNEEKDQILSVEENLRDLGLEHLSIRSTEQNVCNAIKKDAVIDTSAVLGKMETD